MTDTAAEINKLVSYLDTLDFIQGDSPSLSISWYRAANNRRHVMLKNESSFLTFICAVAIRRPENIDGYADGGHYEHLRYAGTDIAEGVDYLYAKARAYVKAAYGRET